MPFVLVLLTTEKTDIDMYMYACNELFFDLCQRRKEIGYISKIQMVLGRKKGGFLSVSLLPFSVPAPHANTLRKTHVKPFFLALYAI
jgi:hypothetical protein